MVCGGGAVNEAELSRERGVFQNGYVSRMGRVLVWGNVPVLNRTADRVYAFHIRIERVICDHIGNEDLVKQVEHFGVESFAVPGERVADCEFIVGGGCGHSLEIRVRMMN